MIHNSGLQIAAIYRRLNRIFDNRISMALCIADDTYTVRNDDLYFTDGEAYDLGAPYLEIYNMSYLVLINRPSAGIFSKENTYRIVFVDGTDGLLAAEEVLKRVLTVNPAEPDPEAIKAEVDYYLLVLHDGLKENDQQIIQAAKKNLQRLYQHALEWELI
ncbi:hypothetical protein PP175_04740 [Aneurinibacillus sp. Ricciae_BoGa-3]|uniref:hypothetical protein n=1 Tax=Aneurinibacillus sp. Ricciae_BoGa-3 TaxID=3022697 RepID=UPI002341B3C3|nr:hypothetical protein [Aneurinibacillus sp. Ricciae_BoGa-3]WCK55293.1 hypothetical protein PP175_04740 [Aneurinibacillus sp. Ricciae_BoGa-3]